MQNKSERIADRFSMVDRWKASGKSIQSFCKSENISYHMFLYWKKQYSKQNISKRFIKIKSADILKVKDSDCEIIFANGNRINFGGSLPEVIYLKELLT
jgi:hypothetical protein